ncbi:MAG: hypothetical protein ACO3GW_05530 [Vulcanococcus sp.]
MATITRKQYLAHTAELFDAYFLQFAGPGYRSALSGKFGPEELLASTDPHFNDIPLARWDDAARELYPYVNHRKITEAEDFYTLSTGVCLAKAMARELISWHR